MSVENPLDEALAASVEGISKAYSTIHEARYRPVVSVFAHLRERRSDAGRRPDPDLVDEDEEDDDDTDEADELFGGMQEEAALNDVSFEVRRGEAVGVIASPEAAGNTVARILCGMTAPTAGRIVVRGRVGPSIELASALTRRETSARGVARRLAGLAGPGRRHRSEFVDAALALAFGDSRGEADVARPPRQVLRRVAAAAAFDPTADVLVIDDVPELGDPEFPLRCRERLIERLSAGAGVVITCPDEDLISELCSRIVWIDGGRVARIATALDVSGESSPPPPSEPEPVVEPISGVPATASPPVPRIRKKPVLRSFSEHAAIHSVELLDAAGSPLEEVRLADWIVLRTEFELADSEPVLVVVRLVGDETVTFVEQRDLRAGAYVATLRIPPGVVPAGEYVIAVGLVLEREGDRRKVGRREAARIRIDGDEEGLALEAETGAVLSGDAGIGTSDAEWRLEAASE